MVHTDPPGTKAPPAPLVKDGAIEIANFAAMYQKVTQSRSSQIFYDGKVTQRDSKAGEVRFDYKRVSETSKITTSLFKGGFNKASTAEQATEMADKYDEPVQDYAGSIHFKKGFVHEVRENMEDGGATLSAPLGTTFDAPEDGQDFVQADLDPVVKMAIETDGFEIALDFNTDQDGGELVYTAEYLDANNGKIRNILEDELKGTGIAFEGLKANDVLADYRGYIVEGKIETSATAYFAQSLSGVKLEEAVEHFMEEKFNLNTEKVSYGDQNATLAGHDQGERVVNLIFQEIREDYAGTHDHEHSEEFYNDPNAHHDNHTHIGYVKNFAKTGGVHNLRMGKEADEGTLAIEEISKERLASLLEWSPEEARANMSERRITGNVTNETIDNIKILYLVEDGEITQEYNAELDQIDVMYNGILLEAITWEEAGRARPGKEPEPIDPTRIAVGQIDYDGRGFAGPVTNADPLLCNERAAGAGINPLSASMEYVTWLTTEFKNMSLLSGNDFEQYNERLADFGAEDKLANLGAHLSDQLGLDASRFINRLKAQYMPTDPESGEPRIILDDDAVSHEIAAFFPELGISVNEEGSLIDSVAALYTKPPAEQDPTTVGGNGTETVSVDPSTLPKLGG